VVPADRLLVAAAEVCQIQRGLCGPAVVVAHIPVGANIRTLVGVGRHSLGEDIPAGVPHSWAGSQADRHMVQVKDSAGTRTYVTPIHLSCSSQRDKT